MLSHNIYKNKRKTTYTTGTGIILVTHSEEQIHRLSDRRYILENGALLQSES